MGLGKTFTALAVTRIAQSHFTTWSKWKPEERTTKDLLQAIGGDFFKLLDGLSIARSRKQISDARADVLGPGVLFFRVRDFVNQTTTSP